MDKQDQTKTPKTGRQRHYETRELQLSVAVLAVLALLGGIILQAVSSELTSYYGLSPQVLSLLLIVGYVLLVALIAIFFTYRLLGPFKRLEYEMKLISAGELSRRLSIRRKDDLHIRNFVSYVNTFISEFEDMSKEYNRLNSALTKKMDEITSELSKEPFDCEKAKREIKVLQKEIRELREKW